MWWADFTPSERRVVHDVRILLLSSVDSMFSYHDYLPSQAVRVAARVDVVRDGSVTGGRLANIGGRTDSYLREGPFTIYMINHLFHLQRDWFEFLRQTRQQTIRDKLVCS